MSKDVESPESALEKQHKILCCLREEICAEELTKLAAHINEQLQADAGLVWRLAHLRRQLLAAIEQKCASAGRKRKGGGGPLYEFNNIFSRFYIAARNALTQASIADDALVKPYEKMVAELGEKGLEKPDPNKPLRNLDDLPGPPSLEKILSEMSTQDKGHNVVYSFCSISMIVPRSRESTLFLQAKTFARRFGDDADSKASKIWQVTVLNYLLASSSLYWGFGPDVYKKAESAGAVIECFASPFNHSLPVYCSPCFPLDLVFGSLGSFYDSLLERYMDRSSPGSLLVANPPYLETELLACFERVDFLVQKGSKAISIYPRWDGCHAVKLFRERVGANEESGFVISLDANAHAYFDYQEWQQVPARFASLGFALGNSKSSFDSTPLREIFEALKCEDVGSSRKRARMST